MVLQKLTASRIVQTFATSSNRSRSMLRMVGVSIPKRATGSLKNRWYEIAFFSSVRLRMSANIAAAVARESGFCCLAMVPSSSKQPISRYRYPYDENDK